MRFTFFYAEALRDADAYSIRVKTLKEAKEGRFTYRGLPSHGPIYRVTVEYKDGFDLFNRCLGEGGWGGLIIESVLARGEQEPDPLEES